MNFGRSTKAFDNIRSLDSNLQIGNSYVKTISLVDVENIELPNEIYPYTTLGGNGAIKDTAVDNFSLLMIWNCTIPLFTIKLLSFLIRRKELNI
jgi:hypothetical protein